MLIFRTKKWFSRKRMFFNSNFCLDYRTKLDQLPNTECVAEYVGTETVNQVN